MPIGKDGGKRGAGVRSSRASRDRGGELRRFEPVSDELVLAAVERAERHRERRDEGVMMSDIAEHLGFVHGSWTTRRLRPQIEAFIAAGVLVRSRRHGVLVWGLTSSGRRRVEGGDASVGLPESPQHRVWRHARALAAERIDEVCEQASGVLEEVMDALDSEGVHSDAWFALAERLQLSWLRARIAGLRRDDRWQTLARAALRDDLARSHRSLTAAVVLSAPPGTPPTQLLDGWSAHYQAATARCLQLIVDIRAAGHDDLATLTVALREVRGILELDDPIPVGRG